LQSDCSDQSKRWRGKDNHSTHEIARYLKITEKAVYRHMDRLKEKVKKIFE
jgi:RNA polymerase sigma-70 factor (ECF subfamily)